MVTCLPGLKQLACLVFHLWSTENTEYGLEGLTVTTVLPHRCLASNLSLTVFVGEELLTAQFGARRSAAVERERV